MKVYIGRAGVEDKMAVSDADYVMVCGGPNDSPVMIAEPSQGNTGIMITTNDAIEKLAERLRAHGFTVTKQSEAEDAQAEEPDAGS